jgi:hypothetical protein
LKLLPLPIVVVPWHIVAVVAVGGGDGRRRVPAIFLKFSFN